MLHKRQLIPPVTMQTADGRIVRAWDFKQKKNLVIAFFDAGCSVCEEFLDALARRAADLKEREALVLAVYLERVAHALSDRMPQEIIVGADVSGRSIRNFLGEDAVTGGSRRGRGIFVTDRYGEISALWVPNEHEFPSARDILSSLEHIEIACEECFMPHWPVDE
jgi:peroxiredoxin